MNIRCLFLPCKWVHIADTTDCGIWQCLYCKTVSRGRKKDKAGYVDQDPNPGRWKTKAERDKLAARVRMLEEAQREIVANGSYWKGEDGMSYACAHCAHKIEIARAALVQKERGGEEVPGADVCCHGIAIDEYCDFCHGGKEKR